MSSQFLIYWTSIVILLLLVATSDSASMSKIAYKTDNDCAKDESVEITCQMCAKVTKSNIVFPLCCEGLEEAREWCVKYLEFGLREKDSVVSR